MRRDLVINILLIITGIVLALVLFGAGAMWRSRVSAPPARSSLNKVGGNASGARVSNRPNQAVSLIGPPCMRSTIIAKR